MSTEETRAAVACFLVACRKVERSIASLATYDGEEWQEQEAAIRRAILRLDSRIVQPEIRGDETARDDALHTVSELRIAFREAREKGYLARQSRRLSDIARLTRERWVAS